MKKILFREELFRAIINGRKTQTRRIAKPQPTNLPISWDAQPLSIHPYYDKFSDMFYYDTEDGVEYIKPRYRVGEKVYLAEPYAIANEGKCCYKHEPHNILFLTVAFENIKWENPFFMPQKYARYFIEITAVRCERLQDISEEDCLAEGIEITMAYKNIWSKRATIMYKRYLPIENTEFLVDTPRKSYSTLIDKICGKGTWASNPYVWVYEFKLLS